MCRAPVLLRLIVLLFFLFGSLQARSEESFSSPKETLKTLLTILRDGHLNRVAACFVEPQTEREENMLLYGMGEDSYRPALHRALCDKFGEQASPLDKVLASFDQQLAVVDSMEAKIDGSNGRLSVKGIDKAGLSFVRVGDDWKIALVPGLMLREIAPQNLAAAKSLRSAYLATVEEIEQGRFASAEQALQELDARRGAAQAGKNSRPQRPEK